MFEQTLMCDANATLQQDVTLPDEYLHSRDWFTVSGDLDDFIYYGDIQREVSER